MSCAWPQHPRPHRHRRSETFRIRSQDATNKYAPSFTIQWRTRSEDPPKPSQHRALLIFQNLEIRDESGRKRPGCYTRHDLCSAGGGFPGAPETALSPPSILQMSKFNEKGRRTSIASFGANGQQRALSLKRQQWYPCFHLDLLQVTGPTTAVLSLHAPREQ